MTEHDSPQPTTFGLIRDHDVTGISGTGRVADGTLWPDGTVSVRWRGDRPSIVHWDALADVERVHGHGGHTRIVWDTEQQAPTPWAYQQACKALEKHRERADTAEATVARIRAFVEDMRTWCSPHGVATEYADRLLAALDSPSPVTADTTTKER